MRAQFAALDVAPGRVVMLGDSITEFGLRQEWFADEPVLNRGIGGGTSADLLRRLDTAIQQPAAVFLLIGTNDLTMGFSLQRIVADVRAILHEIARRAPGTRVVGQSVMLRTPRFRDDIRLLKRAFQELVDETGSDVEYLDLWSALGDESGVLRRAFTGDGLQLFGDGYAAWAAVLRPHVERSIRG